jgi:hypothetical protein
VICPVVSTGYLGIAVLVPQANCGGEGCIGVSL